MDVLLICGGGGAEHAISLLSADFFAAHLRSLEGIRFHRIEITPGGEWRGENGESYHLQRKGILGHPGGTIQLDFAIPCIHGTPGEDGRIQALFELMELPYLGSDPDASLLAFDKVSTKLWAEALGIPTTPFEFIQDSSPEALSTAAKFQQEWGEVFVKASRQGSSLGISRVTQKSELEGGIREAFQYSPVVLIEQSYGGREVELAVYEYGGALQASAPGEILCRNGFYDYRQKYADDSSTRTSLEAKGLDPKSVAMLKDYARRIFCGLGCQHLARVDFFVADNGDIVLNEINTFPGHTSISMFPMMMEHNGHSYRTFLSHIITGKGGGA